MMIGGNVTCTLEKFVKIGENEIGQAIKEWRTYATLFGWLDYREAGETTEIARFKSKLERSTHVFICDYVNISDDVRGVRFIDHRGRDYEVLIIDNPMELNRQIEIYLRYVGDENGE